jgi:hypothetical protein
MNVQFIGYAIPTIPLAYNWVEDPGHGNFVDGEYKGWAWAAADIEARIALVMSALVQTLNSGAVDMSPTTLKIFVMPEFSFRGRQGAYKDTWTADYFAFFRKEFAKRVAAPLQQWLFVLGTIVNTDGCVRGTPQQARIRENLAMALLDALQYASNNNHPELEAILSSALKDVVVYCRKNPIYTVMDRSYVVAGGCAGGAWPEGLSTQKAVMSNEDFVLNFYGDVVSEEDCAYPPIKYTCNGENKQTAFDPFGIFTIEGIKFGLEVCDDHLFQRLRNNRAPNSELVQIQIVPSCGMQIVQQAIVAGAGGYVFNCDGEYGGQDPSEDYIFVGAASNSAHTQLAQVEQPCSDGPLGSNSTNAQWCAPPATVTKVTIDAPSASKLYACGAGEVHVFSPLPVPPPV